MDYEYSNTPEPQYLNVNMDGTYINTKIFASTYEVLAEGPFVPLVQTDSQGNITGDNTKKNVKIKGTKEGNFQVEPFLKVSWSDEPYLDEHN